MNDDKVKIEQELIHDRHIAKALVKSWPFLAFMLLAHASITVEYQKIIFIDTSYSMNIYIASSSILLGIGLGFLILDAAAIRRIRLNQISYPFWNRIICYKVVGFYLIICERSRYNNIRNYR